MSFNPSVFWRFCVISLLLVNLGSLGSSQNGSVVPVVSSPAGPSPLDSHEHHLKQSNLTNPIPAHNASLKISSENHPSGRHLSTPKNATNVAVTGTASDPHAPHEAIATAQIALSTVSPHHVSVKVEKPDAENIILDMTHSEARQNIRSAKWNPTFAAIVAAICITTAIGAYVMLMAWRKIEMDRYGNRQMLINEDDFGDIQDEDMRHFEMQELRSVTLVISPSHRKSLSP
uniref:Metalloreductase STEAP3 n=1 Tax=Lygus hesperus TaxID=30085 RepID=A0A0A9X5H4_LYGHE